MSIVRELKRYDKPPAHYKEVPIQAAPIRTLIKVIKKELLKEAYEPDVENISDPEFKKHVENLNDRIRKAWARETGTRFVYTPPVIPFLHGEPGHGKTTACKLAAQEVASDLSLNFISRPTNDYEPTLNDFLYIQMELAGEVSGITQGGLTVKGEDANGNEYMHKVPLRQLQMAKDAAFSFIVYDDVKNAAPSIQNILMAVMEERAFQGNKLGRVGIAGTGNFGTDGTNVHQMSSANMTRMMNFASYDTVGDFINRVLTGKQNKAPVGIGIDVAGDAVTSFLLKNPEMFSEKPEREKVNGTYANPRSWSKLIDKLRSDVHEHLTRESVIAADLSNPDDKGYKDIVDYAQEIGLEPTKENIRLIQLNAEEKQKEELGSTSLIDRVKQTVGGIIGVKQGRAGDQFSEYLYRRLSYGTDLMADAIIQNGKLTSEQNKNFIDNYSGQSVEARDFGHHMVVSMAEAAAQPLSNAMRENDHDEVKRIAKNFTKGMFAPADVTVEGQQFNVALDDGEINRGLYFLISKTAGHLKDSNKLRPSSTGYLMDSVFLKSFLTGAAQESTAAQTVGDNNKTRYDLMSDMLTNQKETDAVASDDLATLLQQSVEEKVASANEVNQVEKDNQRAKEEQQKQQANQRPQAEPTPEKQASVEPEDFELEQQVEAGAEKATKAASPSATIDPFDQDDDFELEPDSSIPSGTKDVGLSANNSATSNPSDEDLKVEKHPEDEIEFDQDGDLDLDIPKASGMGR